jgi:hypothetical protein
MVKIADNGPTIVASPPSALNELLIAHAPGSRLREEAAPLGGNPDGRNRVYSERTRIGAYARAH